MAPLVTLHLWGVPHRAVPRAVLHMATDRLALRRTPGLRFAKLLGTGSGRTFTVRDADPLRWGLLAVWDDAAAAGAFEAGPVPSAWRRFADEQWAARLEPLAARGRWSRREPFGEPQPRPWPGPVAAVTRAPGRPAVRGGRSTARRRTAARRRARVRPRRRRPRRRRPRPRAVPTAAGRRRGR